MHISDFEKQLEDMLNKMSREELIQLNRMVVHRIKLMDDLKRMAANSQFRPGDRVSWKDNQGMYHEGIVTRINTKTISVQEDHDEEGIWRISAGALTKLR